MNRRAQAKGTPAHFRRFGQIRDPIHHEFDIET